MTPTMVEIVQVTPSGEEEEDGGSEAVILHVSTVAVLPGKFSMATPAFPLPPPFGFKEPIDQRKLRFRFL